MASINLSGELGCSVCLDIYKEPTMLRCGHNFCKECVERVLDTQMGSGSYSCPDCREKFRERPTLQRNITLCEIVENLQTGSPAQQDTEISCTYCIHSAIPAVKSCLHCEASLCEEHLRVHSKSPEHGLCDPTTSPGNRKCSIHNKILEYYCMKDNVRICVFCRLEGGHLGHQVEMLDTALDKKEKLRNVFQKLLSQKEDLDKRVQRLQERRRTVEEKAVGETEVVTALLRDIRRWQEDLEKKVLSEISRQVERLLLPVSELIQQLEMKTDKLSKKLRHIEELCNMTDPLTILQDSCTGDLRDIEHKERRDQQLHDGGDLDVLWILNMLIKGLNDIITGVNGGSVIQKVTNLVLDINTNHNDLLISEDRQTASISDISQNLSETPTRFVQSPQVLSSQSFSSGRCYWEVEVKDSHSWRVGMCYPTIDPTGRIQSLIGHNNKSWGLERLNSQYSVMHESKVIKIPTKISIKRVRVYLDYEAGQLSFYDLCDPIRHLHTFAATFTEPLHAALGVWRGWIQISRDVRYLSRVW